MYRPIHRIVFCRRVCVCLMVLCLCGCNSTADKQRYDYSGETMGTYYRISIIDESDDGHVLIQSSISDILEAVNAQMSTYREDSQISRFNNDRSGHWFEVSSDLVLVSNKAQEIYEQTKGLFDPTIGPLVNLWSFGPEQVPLTVPDNKDLSRVKQSIGADKLTIRDQPPAFKKLNASIELDLSAIAKGFAVDKIAEYLLSIEQQNFLVDIGGELRSAGLNLSNQPWQVGIEKPQAQRSQSIQQIVSISGESIATSGNYRNYFEKDNKRYSHILNPQSGYPIEHKLVSVSVISDDCMSADGYATALMVLGPQRGYDFALQYGLAVYMIEKKGDEFVSKFTPQMKPFME